MDLPHEIILMMHGFASEKLKRETPIIQWLLTLLAIKDILDGEN